MKVGTLEAEVTSHYAAVDELNREHSAQVDELTEQKALMEVCVAFLDGWVICCFVGIMSLYKSRWLINKFNLIFRKQCFN